MRFSDITFFIPLEITLLDSCGIVLFDGYSSDIPCSLYFKLLDYTVKSVFYGINGLYIVLNGNLEKEE